MFFVKSRECEAWEQALFKGNGVSCAGRSLGFQPLWVVGYKYCIPDRGFLCPLVVLFSNNWKVKVLPDTLWTHGLLQAGIHQARMVEWVVFPFSRGFAPRNQTRDSCIAGGFFTSWAVREAQITGANNFNVKILKEMVWHFCALGWEYPFNTGAGVNITLTWIFDWQMHY